MQFHGSAILRRAMPYLLQKIISLTISLSVGKTSLLNDALWFL